MAHVVPLLVPARPNVAFLLTIFGKEIEIITKKTLQILSSPRADIK